MMCFNLPYVKYSIIIIIVVKMYNFQTFNKIYLLIYIVWFQIKKKRGIKIIISGEGVRRNIHFAVLILFLRWNERKWNWIGKLRNWLVCLLCVYGWTGNRFAISRSMTQYLILITLSCLLFGFSTSRIPLIFSTFSPPIQSCFPINVCFVFKIFFQIA